MSSQSRNSDPSGTANAVNGNDLQQLACSNNIEAILKQVRMRNFKRQTDQKFSKINVLKIFLEASKISQVSPGANQDEEIDVEETSPELPTTTQFSVACSQPKTSSPKRNSILSIMDMLNSVGPTDQKEKSSINLITCHTCGLTCNGQSHYEVHIRSHTGERPFKCHIGKIAKKFY